MTEIQLSHSSIFVLYGKAGSSKSSLAKYLIYHFQTKQLCDLVFVLSGTSFNEYYQQFLPKNQVKPYDEIIINNLLNLCKKKKEAGIDFRVLLILDDILGSIKSKSDTILKLINNHRHFNISVIISSQYPNAISPNIREGCSLAFIFHATTKRAIQALYESYGASDFDKINDFIKFLNDNTREYNCIVVDNKKVKFEEKWAVFKSPMF